MNSIPIADVLINIQPSFANLPAHWQIFESAVKQLDTDSRVLGLYLSGSFANGKPDRWSDIDLYIVVGDGQADSIIVEHQKIITSIAPIATIFPATHLGDSHQIIVFYKANEPIHVDFQYKEFSELKPRRQDANIKIILDRTGTIEHYKRLCSTEKETRILSQEKVQYLEDRFWGWCWYAHTKIKRRELWEARDMLEYLRSNVLIPLSHGNGQPLEGNRRLEIKLSKPVQDILEGTIPHEHSTVEYSRVLTAIMKAYIELFDKFPKELLIKVIKVNREYFKKSIDISLVT